MTPTGLSRPSARRGGPQPAVIAGGLPTNGSRERLQSPFAHRRFDVMCVNAGTVNRHPADTIVTKQGRVGLEDLHRKGKPVPW